MKKSDLLHGFSGLVYPFRLVGEPLVRIALVLDDETTWLFFDPHHIVFDGESLTIFFRDLEKAYAGEVLGKEAFTGYEAALVEKELRETAAYQKAKDYFTSLLSGRDSECLPIRDRSNSLPEAGFLTLDVSVSRQQVDAFLKREKLTANALWNAAFGLTLSRFIARDECVYTTVYNGRNDPRLSDSVGMFVHSLPVACDPQEGEDGRSFVARMGRQLTASMSHDIYSFAEIVHDLGGEPRRHVRLSG